MCTCGGVVSGFSRHDGKWVARGARQRGRWCWRCGDSASGAGLTGWTHVVLARGTMCDAGRAIRQFGATQVTHPAVGAVGGWEPRDECERVARPVGEGERVQR